MTASRAARALAFALSLAFASAALAAPERIPFKQDEGEFGALMWRSILVTAGLIVVALGAIYVMRRYNFLPPASPKPVEGGSTRVLQTLRLGPRASLHVVEFEGRRILVGQSEKGVGLIASAAGEERE